MITPKRILVFLLGLFMLGLYTLIFGQGGYVRMWKLSDEFAMLQEENHDIREVNEQMTAEIKSLRTGLGAIEERARYDFNMVKAGEVLFRIQRPQKTLPGTEIPADIINDPLYRPAELPPGSNAKPLL